MLPELRQHEVPMFDDQWSNLVPLSALSPWNIVVLIQ